MLSISIIMPLAQTTGSAEKSFSCADLPGIQSHRRQGHRCIERPPQVGNGGVVQIEHSSEQKIQVHPYFPPGTPSKLSSAPGQCCLHEACLRESLYVVS